MRAEACAAEKNRDDGSTEADAETSTLIRCSGLPRDFL
jgi:hypothetical protein